MIYMLLSTGVPCRSPCCYSNNMILCWCQQEFHAGACVAIVMICVDVNRSSMQIPVLLKKWLGDYRITSQNLDRKLWLGNSFTAEQASCSSTTHKIVYVNKRTRSCEGLLHTCMSSSEWVLIIDDTCVRIASVIFCYEYPKLFIKGEQKLCKVWMSFSNFRISSDARARCQRWSLLHGLDIFR